MAALRERNFRFYVVSRFCSAGAMMLLSAAIAWQVFDLTGSVLQLGVIGLVRFLPSLGLSLVGGAVADSYDRRKLILATQALMLTGGAILTVITAGGVEGIWLIYAVVLLVAVAGAFEAPARQALVPSLVTQEAFPNAIVVGSTVQQLAFVTGPALGGGLIALGGVQAAYGAYALLILTSLVMVLLMRPRAVDGPKRAVSISAIIEGVQFVRSRQVLLGAMTLDMFAVIFGGARALWPVYATEILDVGAWGYGLLYASLEVGAVLMALSLIFLPQIERTGRALILSVAAFGFGTIVFGLSRDFWLSIAACGFIGAADQVSVVMRQTTIQLATPDHLRGRVTSVNMLFIGASNQLGDVESGLVAAVTNATFAVVSGGMGCLAVVGIVAAKLPELRNYRLPRPGTFAPEAAPEPEPAAQAKP